jgi:hypothetical protein
MFSNAKQLSSLSVAATAKAACLEAAVSLRPVIGKTKTQLLGVSTEIAGATGSSIDYFYEILKAMQETLNFKTGPFVSACICFAELFWTSLSSTI